MVYLLPTASPNEWEGCCERTWRRIKLLYFRSLLTLRLRRWPRALPPQGEEEPVLLVIERNSEVRRLLHAYFDQHGYHVLEAADCEEALLLAQGRSSGTSGW